MLELTTNPPNKKSTYPLKVRKGKEAAIHSKLYVKNTILTQKAKAMW